MSGKNRFHGGGAVSNRQTRIPIYTPPVTSVVHDKTFNEQMSEAEALLGEAPEIPPDKEDDELPKDTANPSPEEEVETVKTGSAAKADDDKKKEIKYEKEIFLRGKGKLIVTKEVKEHIDFLHSRVGSVEWSGLLVYELVSGNLIDVDQLVLKTRYIHLMDVGTGAYTEYRNSDESLMLYDDFPEAENMRIGHIHSHHNMQAYFSGTDKDELKDNAHNHNIYLSLIVSFDERYAAKIAIHGESKSVASSVISFTDCDESERRLEIRDVKESVSNVLCIAELDIEIEPSENTAMSKLMSRLAYVKDKFRRVPGFNRNEPSTTYRGPLDRSYSPRGEQLPSSGLLGEQRSSAGNDGRLSGNDGGLTDDDFDEVQTLARYQGIQFSKKQLNKFLALMMSSDWTNPSTQITEVVKEVNSSFANLVSEMAIEDASDSITRFWTMTYVSEAVVEAIGADDWQQPGILRDRNAVRAMALKLLIESSEKLFVMGGLNQSAKKCFTMELNRLNINDGQLNSIISKAYQLVHKTTGLYPGEGRSPQGPRNHLYID